ncbi:MAG: hypothetical protein V4480_00605 [Patescibacteria group bacterium]
MKTLTELNSKWWYRLLKVLYIILALIILGVSIALIVVSNAPEFDNKASYVQCDDGRTFPVDKIGMYSDFVDSYNDRNFRTWCATTLVEENGVQKLKPINGFVPDEKNFTFVAKETARNWMGTIGYSVIALVVVLLLSELLRRMFYYITLGSIRPKRQ